MGIYIKSYSSISPYNFDKSSELIEERIQTGPYFKCLEPEYKDVINPALLRRMSRVVKMGVYAGLSALKKINVEIPDAIITGTALGCIEDTESFLVSIIKNNEQFLSPTPFIQSTHNTIGAQIALILKCNNYNFTYVNRNSSFEDAVTDAIMLINDNDAENVLVGGVDELTENSFKIMSRLGLYKNFDGSDISVIKSSGAFGGEGAAFFVLDGNSENAICEIKTVRTYNNLDNENVSEKLIAEFLDQNNLKAGDIDVLLTGISGDSGYDMVYDHAMSLFYESAKCIYKNLCGEYFTSSSFAVNLASEIIKNQIIPNEIAIDNINKCKIGNVLIYNQFKNINHSLILLSGC
jgi:3-oxoacyl-(acyl-carrier-protein) synthase